MTLSDNGGRFAAEICQKYKKRYHFATLYNTQFRTPIYSAYKIESLTQVPGLTNIGHNLPQQSDSAISKTWKYEAGLLNNQPSSGDQRINHGMTRNAFPYAFLKPECPVGTLIGECRRQEEEMLMFGQSPGQSGISQIKWCPLPNKRNCELGTDLRIFRYMQSDLQNYNDYGHQIRLSDTDIFNAGRLYDKGHLYPNMYAKKSGVAAQESTFTVTNAAPQNPCLNSGRWKIAETALLRFMEENCQSNTQKIFNNYFLTGTGYNYVTTNDGGLLQKKRQNGRVITIKKIPATNTDGDTIFETERIAVPDFFWTAACCIAAYGDGSFGFAMETDRNDETAKVNSITMKQLETKLSDNWKVLLGNGGRKGGIQLFGPSGPRDRNPCHERTTASRAFENKINFRRNQGNIRGTNTVEDQQIPDKRIKLE